MSIGQLLVDAPESEWPAIESAALLVTIADLKRSKAMKMIRRAWGPELAKRATKAGKRFIVVMRGPLGASALGVDDVAELAEIHRGLIGAAQFLSGHLEIFTALDPETHDAMTGVIREQQLFQAVPAGCA